MIAALVVLFHILGLVSALHSVMSTRTSQGSIAWAVTLVTFPYVAVPAYWVFGRSKFEGYVLARRSADDRTQAFEQEAIETGTPFLLRGDDRVEAVRAGEQLAGMPVLRGNHVDLLVDGDATFDSIFRGIDEAADYVLVQFYIIKDDGLGGALKDKLIAATRRGVRAYVLYDEIGSVGLTEKYKRELRDAGVEVREFNTRKGRRNRFQLNFRNHRKIGVGDGRIAWIGGHHVGDEYLGKDPKFGHWRDTHLRIEGPAVLKAQLSFAEDWHWATDETPSLSWRAQAAPGDSDMRVLVIPSGPADDLETASLMFVHAIQAAKERIWIASPYFVPDEAIMSALQLAGLRGVDVRILVPDNPDHMIVYLAAFAYFDDASKTGAKIYRYTDGFLHEKAMLIDDTAAAIGTANFDNRSFRLNFEVTTFVGDSSFVAQVQQMFEADFARSRLMAPGEYESKPWYFRLGVRLARLMAPIL